FVSIGDAEPSPLFSLSRRRFHRHSVLRRLESALLRRSFRHRRWHNRPRDQRCFAQRLHFRLSFPSPLDRRLSRSTGKIDINVRVLPVCDLLKSAPHALGVAEFVLGRLYRSLRTSVFSGNLARLSDPLTNGRLRDA